MSSLRDSYQRITNTLSVSESFEESIIANSLAYSVEQSILALAPEASYDLIIRTNNRQTLLLESSLQFNEERVEVLLTKDPSVITGDTAVSPSPMNLNQFSIDPPALLATVTEEPTSLSGGTILSGPTSYLGTAGQGNRIGSGTLTKNDNFMWLDFDSVYVWTITNKSVAALDLTVAIKFAESADFNLR